MKDEHADLRSSFWSTLQAQLATIPPRAMVGVFGDLNVRLRAKRSFEEVIGPYVFGKGHTYIDDEDETQNRPLAIDMCTTLGYKFANTFKASKPIQQITFGELDAPPDIQLDPFSSKL